MKIRNLIIGSALLTSLCSASLSQKPASNSKLERIVQRARTHSITPRDTPPSWMDFDKVRAGGDFIKKHLDFINQILGTSSLASTYAAKDITPVLMQTGRLPKDFSRRLNETTEYIKLMMLPINGRDEFVSKNLATGYKLGQIHVGVAKQMKVLHWNRKERIPINLQSFALVLESFAWWPVEALEATKQIDCTMPDKEIEGWFHFWSVMGYELGVSEELLPTSYAKAKELVALLKKA